MNRIYYTIFYEEMKFPNIYFVVDDSGWSGCWTHKSVVWIMGVNKYIVFVYCYGFVARRIRSNIELCINFDSKMNVYIGTQIKWRKKNKSIKWLERIEQREPKKQFEWLSFQSMIHILFPYIKTVSCVRRTHTRISHPFSVSVYVDSKRFRAICNDTTNVCIALSIVFFVLRSCPHHSYAHFPKIDSLILIAVGRVRIRIRTNHFCSVPTFGNGLAS